MRRQALSAAIALGLMLGLGGAGGLGGAPAAADPPMVERKVEILKERPSGFWTSNRPATGGAYRYRLLGIGVLLAAGAGFLMWKLTRKANAERLARGK
jgi:hypothetical protein